MPILTIEYATDAERLMLEQAIAFVADMRSVAANAPNGTVIDACEALALSSGRKLLQDSFEHAVQTRIDAADLKKKRPANARKGRGPGLS